jgi:predicted RNase H-like HicB family nuclease
MRRGIPPYRRRKRDVRMGHPRDCKSLIMVGLKCGQIGAANGLNRHLVGLEKATYSQVISEVRWAMNLTLSAVYEEVPESEGGGYVAYTEELPGAISEGNTLEEARENLRDAIEVLVAANRELAGQSHRGKKLRVKISRFP